jgi:hypothetical protein
VTDQELDRAVNAAIETINARANLKDALLLFVRNAMDAHELLVRAIEERGGDVRSEDVQRTNRILKSELMWSKHLLGLIRDHDFEGRAS